MAILTNPSPPVTIETRHRNPNIEAAIALAVEQRGQLKVLAKFCRQVERDRNSSVHDKRRAARMRYAVSGALSLLRAGGRR